MVVIFNDANQHKNWGGASALKKLDDQRHRLVLVTIEKWRGISF